MPQVEFHILRSQASAARLRYACGVVERAWLEGRRSLVWIDPAELPELDALLWTFAEGSFVAHDEYPGGAEDGLTPVLLSAGPLPATPLPLLVNLTARAVPGEAAWPRIVEVVDADEVRRRQGRERFRAYRERNWPLQTIEIEQNS